LVTPISSGQATGINLRRFGAFLPARDLPNRQHHALIATSGRIRGKAGACPARLQTN